MIIICFVFIAIQDISYAEQYECLVNYITVDSDGNRCYYYKLKTLKSIEEGEECQIPYKEGDTITINGEQKKITGIQVGSDDNNIGNKIIFLYYDQDELFEKKFEMPAADVTIEYIISDSDE